MGFILEKKTTNLEVYGEQLLLLLLYFKPSIIVQLVL